MSDRNSLRAGFIARAGWGDASERLLAGDASFRKYFRLTRGGNTIVVMDAPPPQEDVQPFVRIGRHLTHLGLSAPDILAEDPAHGFLLLEDLGDDTFARVLAAGGDEGGLYTRATDVLVALHRVEDPELGMDIVDLGLVYDVEIEADKVKVIHTLTSMGCPAGPMIQEDMRTTVAESFPDVKDIELELTWDPPWTPDKMSDDAKFILGFG